MKITDKVLTVIVICVVFLSACSPAGATQVAQNTPQAQGQDPAGSAGYPAGTEEVISPQEGGYLAVGDGKVYAEGELPPTPKTAPKPQDGKASVSGTVFSYTDRVTVTDTVFYLLAVTGDKSVPPLVTGPNQSNGDIASRTDAKGQFSLDSVPPGSYYLVVWAPYSWSISVDPSQDPPKEQLIELKAGDQKALGVVSIHWP